MSPPSWSSHCRDSTAKLSATAVLGKYSHINSAGSKSAIKVLVQATLFCHQLIFWPMNSSIIHLVRNYIQFSCMSESQNVILCFFHVKVKGKKRGGLQSSLKSNANNCWMRKQQKVINNFYLVSEGEQEKDFNKKEPNSMGKKSNHFFLPVNISCNNSSDWSSFLDSLFVLKDTGNQKQNKINFQSPLKKLQWSATDYKLSMPLAVSQFQYYTFIYMRETRHISYTYIYEKIYTYLCIQVPDVRRVTWQVLPRLVSAGRQNHQNPSLGVSGAAGTT